MVTGHDIGWGMADPTSPGYTAANAAWLQSGLRMKYKADPSLITREYGYAGDPISSPNAALGVPYDAWSASAGQSGDEIGRFYDPLVTSAGVYRDDATPDTTSIRWETLAPVGSPANAFWGGTVSRTLIMSQEFTGMVSPNGTPDTSRTGILDRALLWLLGRERPTVLLAAPNGGEVLTSSPTNITWNETVGAGRTVASRKIEYSTDGGDSWTTLTTSAGPSPYVWDTTPIANSPLVKVRIRITDDGAPAFSSTDESNATFQLLVPGSDLQGPVVVAGSIQPTPNPIVIGGAATLLARATDAATGGSTIAAGEFSIGVVAADAGTGTAMTSTFDSVGVNLAGTINTNVLYHGDRTIWVRARDAAGNWGGASSVVVRVNGTDPSGVTDAPRITFLAPAAPNPAAGPMQLRFGLSRAGNADLAVYDATGRLVRSVARGPFTAGQYSLAWDGRDAAGNPAAPGLYFVRLKTGEGTFQKRMVRLN